MNKVRKYIRHSQIDCTRTCRRLECVEDRISYEEWQAIGTCDCGRSGDTPDRGMSKAEVRRLLGASDNSQYETEQGNIDNYFLGHWGFMSIDGDLLVVHYDPHGRLASTKIYSH